MLSQCPSCFGIRQMNSKSLFWPQRNIKILPNWYIILIQNVGFGREIMELPKNILVILASHLPFKDISSLANWPNQSVSQLAGEDSINTKCIIDEYENGTSELIGNVSSVVYSTCGTLQLLESTSCPSPTLLLLIVSAHFTLTNVLSVCSVLQSTWELEILEE